MKKILVTIMAACAVAASAVAQGTINVAYTTGANTVKIDGVNAAGAANARIELLWAPEGTSDLNLFQALGAPISVGVPVAGYFSGGTRTINGIAPGAIVSVVIRGWTLGTGATYNEATTRGITPIFLVDTANPVATPVPEPAQNLNTVFPGLNLTIVPEPSSMALAGLGAAALVFFRRRK